MALYTWQLSVPRVEFSQGLRLVARAGKSVRSAEATLTFDQNLLSIELAGTVAQVSATGDWPSEVRLRGQYLEGLRRALPHDDPLSLKVEGKRLFAARFSIPCEWRMYSHPAATPASEMVPANPDVFDLLMLAARCSQEEIDAAGLGGLVSNAQSKLDRLCAKAATRLTPYGVTPLHLRQLCEAHAAEGNRRFREGDSEAIAQIADAWCVLAPFGVEPLEIKSLMDECLRNAWRNPK